MNIFRKQFSRFNLNGEMLRGTAWMMLSYGVKLSLQLVSFVLLARTLGPESFGTYVAMLSFAVLLEPFFDLGAYHLIVSDITKNVKTSVAIGNSLVLSLLVLPIGLLILYFGHLLIFQDFALILLLEVGLSQFFGGRSISLALGVNIAHGTIWRNAVLEISNGIIRILSVGVLLLSDGKLDTWIHLQLLSSCVFAILIYSWFGKTWGIQNTGLKGVKERLASGMQFAIGYTARNVNTEIDKIMIFKFSSVEGTGIYAAAMRFAAMSCVPVNALLATIHRYFFIEGKKGYKYARRYSMKILPATAAYGVLASLMLFLFADLIISMLGDNFSESAVALRYLAFYPLIQSMLLPFADALTGSDLQKVRSNGTVLSMLLNVILNLVMIPIMGWQGAIIATLLSQTMLLLYVSLYARRYL